VPPAACYEEQQENSRAAGDVGAGPCRELSASRSTVPLKCWSNGPPAACHETQQDKSRAAGQVGAGLCKGAEGQQINRATEMLVQRCHQLLVQKNNSTAGQQDRLVQGRAVSGAVLADRTCSFSCCSSGATMYTRTCVMLAGRCMHLQCTT
jgi:hypothetical protein